MHRNDKPLIQTRYVMCVLSFFGLFNLFALRVNLSVAIVAMVNNSRPASLVDNMSMASTETRSEDCAVSVQNSSGRSVQLNNSTSVETGEFQWNSDIQGLILSAFFYGYFFTQMPGAYVSQRFGAKLPFGFAVLLCGILALLTPAVARWDYRALIGLQVTQGLFAGVTFPAMHCLLGQWCPPLERTKMASFVNTGSVTGTVMTVLLSGFLAEYLGWASIFYFCGGSSCVFFVFWMFFAFDSPAVHPRISPGERAFIIAAIGPKHNNSSSTPWKQFFSSLPVWAICIAHCGNNWGFYTLQTCLPTYMSNILHFRLKDNGITSALPWVSLAVIIPISGILVDKLRKQQIVNTKWTRRILHILGQMIPAASLVAVGYVGCNVPLAVGLLTLAMGGNALAYSGFYINHVDISPSYSGILMGLSNSLATLSGAFSPYVVGLLVSGPKGQTVGNWRIVFYISAAIYTFSALFFTIFSSGELASWEKEKNPKVEETTISQLTPTASSTGHTT